MKDTWIVKVKDLWYHGWGRYTSDRTVAYQFTNQSDAMGVAVQIPRSKVEKF